MSWVDVCLDPVAVLVVGAGLLRAVRTVDHKFMVFKKDWEGEPARAGFPPRPGVMERLSMIENAQIDTANEVAHIKRKLEST